MRGLKLYKYILIILVLSVNVLLWQNCAPAFQSMNTESSEGPDTLGEPPQPGTPPVQPGTPPTNPGSFIKIDAQSTFPRFQKIIKENCLKCHGAAGTQFPNVVKYTGLNTINDWLIHPRGLITAGDPTNSLLYRRLRNSKGFHDPAIQTMPYQSPALSDSDISFIANWIYSAPKNVNRCENHVAKPKNIVLRRLTRVELINSVKTILNINHDFSSLPSAGGGIFGNSGNDQITDQNFFDNYFNEIGNVAAKYVNNSNNQGCFNRPANTQEQCVISQLNPIAELSFRNVLNNDLRSVFTKAINSLSSDRTHNYSAKDKLEAGLMAILTSTQFLYLIRDGNGSGIKNYSNFELATRVSLALFQSVPDRDLWDLAKSGKFSNPSEYKKILSDLLNNPSIYRTYSQNLLEGWLKIDKVKQLRVDEKALGISQNQYNPLADDMKNESIEILRDIVASKKSINNLVTGSTRFLNERLSNHYNINSNIRGNNLQKFELPENSPYSSSGLLTSTLLVGTSHPDRSSLILRGLNVFTNFNCGSMDDAPANTPEIEPEDLGPNATQRDIALEHTKLPACAGCHRAMDPFGVALGKFDALGRYKTKDKFGNNIDTTTIIKDLNINDHKSMARAVASENKFKSCFTGVNISYLTSFNMDMVNSVSDYCEATEISNKLNGSADNIPSLITNILSSDYFLKWNDSN